MRSKNITPYSNLGKNKEGASSLAAQGKDNKDNKEGSALTSKGKKTKKPKSIQK